MVGRVDFVGVAQELLSCVVAARALSDLPVAVNVESDHLASMVHLASSTRKPQVAKFQPWFSRVALRLNSVQECLAACWQRVPSFPVGWSTGVQA